MTMFSLDDQLVMIIDRLNAAINVCHEAPENEDQGYPYATGYARSAMSDVADDLSAILNQMRERVDSWESVHSAPDSAPLCPIISSSTQGTMITSKTQMLRVMSQCNDADTLTRAQKFEVFCRVCDNMLQEGRISKANHKRWTEIW